MQCLLQSYSHGVVMVISLVPPHIQVSDWCSPGSEQWWRGRFCSEVSGTHWSALVHQFCCRLPDELHDSMKGLTLLNHQSSTLHTLDLWFVFINNDCVKLVSNTSTVRYHDNSLLYKYTVSGTEWFPYLWYLESIVLLTKPSIKLFIMISYKRQ